MLNRLYTRLLLALIGKRSVMTNMHVKGIVRIPPGTLGPIIVNNQFEIEG